jgi:hydroxymethylbilane synthase
VAPRTPTLRRFRIGTRGSRLALIQTEWVQGLLQARFPECVFETVVIHTTGDKILDVPLARIGDKGLFTREIDRAMLDGEIDLAVHSLKDLPSRLEAGIALGAVPGREEPWDAWVSEHFADLADVPAGGVVLTGSLRRRAQLLHLRPDLEVRDLRGNVQTRLARIAEPGVAGGVLALAGLKRMGVAERARRVLGLERFVPAVGQGAIGITARADDADALALLAQVELPEVRVAVEGERGFLYEMEGGCQVPMGCHGQLAQGQLTLTAFVAALDGVRFMREQAVGPAPQARALGQGLAQRMLERGAADILGSIRQSPG